MHALRRYAVLQERVKAGEVIVKHIPDPQNAADFLTKWVGIKTVLFWVEKNVSCQISRP